MSTGEENGSLTSEKPAGTEGTPTSPTPFITKHTMGETSSDKPGGAPAANVVGHTPAGNG